ncbi:MAG: hypothetical protein WB709_03780 [Solirubrobacteraceae bacterium]
MTLYLACGAAILVASVLVLRRAAVECARCRCLLEDAQRERLAAEQTRLDIQAIVQEAYVDEP